MSECTRCARTAAVPLTGSFGGGRFELQGGDFIWRNRIQNSEELEKYVNALAFLRHRRWLAARAVTSAQRHEHAQGRHSDRETYRGHWDLLHARASQAPCALADWVAE